MKVRGISAFVFTVLAGVVFAFQVGLALGAPWGSYAMGGVFPGQLPPELRGAALGQAILWVFFSCIMLSRAGIALPGWARASRWLVWIIAAIVGMSLALNIITPSAVERMVWAPVASVMLVCVLLVATGPTPSRQ